MKKLLLSMAAIATMSMVAKADVVTLDFTNVSELNSSVELPTETSTGTVVSDVVFTKGGVSVVATAGTNNDAVIWLTTSNATQYRIYKGATLTISAGDNISKIVINGGNTNFSTANATVDTGSFDIDSKVTTWTGSASTVVFTIGTTANMQINSIVVTTGDSTGDDTETEEPTTPVEDGTIFSETFASSLGEFTTEDVTLPDALTYVWAYNSYGYAKASGYYKQAYATESWLISPVIDLAGRTNCTLDFSCALNYATDCVGAFVREENGAWVAIEDVDYGTGSSWTWSDNAGLDLSAFDGKKIQLGFQYTSTDEAAATWEIKNVVVKGDKNGDGIADVVVENAPVEYFNLQGVRVAEPTSGLYIRRQGNNVAKVVIR